MSKPFSDEEIYSTLEKVIGIISQYAPVGNKKTSSFPDKEILTTLVQQGYNSKMAWAFLKASYWYLADNRIMTITPSVHYSLNHKITGDLRTDLCMNIFSQYEEYFQANYARSLITPDPYYTPEKVPDSSPGFQTKFLSGGK